MLEFFIRRPPAKRSFHDPYTAYRFLVSVHGMYSDNHVCGFSDISGLSVDTEVESFREGGFNSSERQLAGPTKFGTRLTLKRGMADMAHLWRWYRRVIAGEIVRHNVSISVQRSDGSEGLHWTFIDACPVKWTGPELHAATSGVAFESIELVHRGLLLLD